MSDPKLTWTEKLKIKTSAKAATWFLKGLLSEGGGVRKQLIYWKLKKELDKKEAKVMLESIREKLSGKKTYLVAIIGILGAVSAWVSGSIDTTKLIELTIEAILAATIRAGVAKG